MSAEPLSPAPSSAGHDGRSRPLVTALVAEARPKQWIKNLLVVAAPGAAGVLNEPAAIGRTAAAFACFCLAASGTYFLNDVADVEADRGHPTKRHRPIAAGEVPVALARVVGIIALVISVAGAALLDWRLAVVVASYVALTTSYSIWLKHLAVVDVVVVAAGFVLRAIAGGVAVDVPISDWFFIVTSFGSLFMVVGKRRAEAGELGTEAARTRATLGTYSRDFLSHLQTICISVVLVGYCLWAFEKAALTDASIPWFQISIVPFGIAVLRYALLLDTGQGGAPEEVVTRDRSLLAFGAVWILLFAAGVYQT